MAQNTRAKSTLRRILVPLDSKIGARATIETAFQVARLMTSHVRVLMIGEDPTRDEDKYPPAVVDMPPPAGVIRVRGDAEIADRRWREIRRVFDDACAHHRCRIVDGVPPLTRVSASLATDSGEPVDVIARYGRVSDLMVIAKPTSVSQTRSKIRVGGALFETGRPVLVAPVEPAISLGRRIAIAWNDTSEASRAVAAAMRFVVRGEQVFVLTAESQRTPARVADELADYLACHGVTAERRVFAQMRDKPLGGRRLLEECAQAQADLLVMGAFRLGRFHEQVLGRATEEVLESATIPILMAR